MTAPNKTYIVAVDGAEHSRKAARFALEQARTVGADLVVAHVVEWSDRTWINAIELDYIPTIRRAAEEKARDEILTPIVRELEGQGPQVTTELRFGDPAQALCDIAQEKNALLICTGARGRSDVASMILGSVTHQLIHMSKVPLLLVP